MAVMAPVAGLFVLLRQPIVWLLYSSEFQGILTLVAWGMIGCVWRTLSWCLAFTILAKGDGKTYLWTEVASAIINLVLNILFYRWWGLTGLGIAFLVSYLLYTLIIAVVYFKNYRLTVTRACIYNLLWTLAVTSCVLAAMECGKTVIAAVLTTLSVAIASRQIIALWKR